MKGSYMLLLLTAECTAHARDSLPPFIPYKLYMPSYNALISGTSCIPHYPLPYAMNKM